MIDVLGLIETIFPSKCAACGGIVKELGLCRECMASIDPVESHCLGCGLPLNTGFFEFCGNCIDKRLHFDEIWVLYPYQKVSKLILDFKLNRSLKAKKAIEALINKSLPSREKVYSFKGIDVITFVPIDWKKAFKREFNQSEEIARIMGKMTEKPVKPLLKKVKATRDQTELSPSERAANVKGAFKALSEAKGKTILIVDDVATTLNTLNHCGLALKKEKAKKVIAFSFSRATHV
ncbi:MAG: ComF family protein [Deferribacteres bacterium]|nr:ComF family protein [Deferribacteres bacterium]